MCGISGIVNTRNFSVQDSLLRAMNARIAHRGPDNDGIYSGSNFGLGHRRLAIIDTGHLNHQPFRYLGNVITFNGEIYNHDSLRHQLQAKGYIFTTRGDTEVILAAYDCWGQDCVSKFEGMWAFIIYDHNKQILFGSRDRFGQKPFYYTEAGPFFVMASEIKQFMDIPQFRPALNEEVAFNYLNYSALNYSDETFFRDVQSLTPGHNLVYNLSTHQYRINKWYFFPEGRVLNIDLGEAAEEFNRLFRESVATRLNSDVKVGACLSGGLDSSSIVCMSDDILNDESKLVTLSICWNDKTIDERQYIELVTRHTSFASIKIFPDINDLNEKDLLGKIIYHQDQPILSASHFAEYKVYEAAGNYGLPVMLDGQGADEYLGGYGIFNWYHLHNLFSANRFVSLGQEWTAIRKASNFSDSQMLKNFLFIKYKMHKPRLSPIMEQRWGNEYLNGNPMLPPANSKLSAKNLSHSQLFSSSLPYQLHSADRNSMSHSVEARLPFLDHRLVEFCYALPDEFKINKGLSKIVLREGLGSLLPREIRERTTKLGFPAPECQWVKDNREWIQSELEENADVLDKFVDISKLDHSTYFRVLSFARWLKIFNVSLVQFAVLCL